MSKYATLKPPARSPLRRVLIVLLAVPGFVGTLCLVTLVFYIIIPPAPLDVLVLGVDARAGEGYATRTDSIMLMGVQPSQRRISLLSIPRDLFISVPGYGNQRINTVNVLGEAEAPGYGPELLAQSIDLSFGIQPDRYMRLDFRAFEELIDAVGGVTIDVQRAIFDDNYPTGDGGTRQVTFEVGRQHMDGETALIYARSRYSDDDYFRAGRQQQVLMVFTRKMLNPLHWPAVLRVLQRRVDTDLSISDLIVIAPAVLFEAGNFDRLVIDREYIRPMQGGAAPDYDALNPWIEPRFD